MKCKLCARQLKGFCTALKAPINPNLQDCPMYIQIIDICPICGRGIPSGTGMIPNEYQIMICNECGKQLYSCGTCANRPVCKVDNYHGLEPLIIHKQMRHPQNPNMILSVDVPNEELIKKLCASCICESMVNCRMLSTCDKYKFILDK